MKKKKLLTIVLRGFLVISLIDLVLIAVVAGIGWWTGWTDQDNFKTAIQVAGLVVIGLGLLGIKGNPDIDRSFEHNQSRPVSDKDSWERTLLDLAQSYSFMLIMFIAGGVCLLIGRLM